MKWIEHILGREIETEVAADHLELGEDYTVLGLKMNFYNPTKDAIFINGISLMLYLDGKRGVPRSFTLLESFIRVTGQRAFQKNPVSFFTLHPGEAQARQLRFLHSGGLAISAGTYRLAIPLADNENVVRTSKATLEVKPGNVFRPTEEWYTG